jgi:hypothetical protein
MTVHYAIALCHNALHSVLEFCQRLPAPAAAVLLIAAGVCLYGSLGNTRLAPGKWR